MEKRRQKGGNNVKYLQAASQREITNEKTKIILNESWIK